MGKISILTKEQREILDQITVNTYLRDRFYLTGGTALAEFYLQHRYSEDLDFFSEERYDTQVISTFIRDLARSYGFSFESELLDFLYRFRLIFPNKYILKLDFSYYIGRRAEKGPLYKGFAVDSLLDIAINKLSTINQRHNVKDYVDLYFLSRRFSIWYLMEGVRIKFRMKMEPWNLGSDFLYVERFEEMPRMIKPLSLVELKRFYRNLGMDLAKKAVE